MEAKCEEVSMKFEVDFYVSCGLYHEMFKKSQYDFILVYTFDAKLNLLKNFFP